MTKKTIITDNNTALLETLAKEKGIKDLPPIFFNDEMIKKMSDKGGLEKLNKILKDAQTEHQKMMTTSNN